MCRVVVIEYFFEDVVFKLEFIGGERFSFLKNSLGREVETVKVLFGEGRKEFDLFEELRENFFSWDIVRWGEWYR